MICRKLLVTCLVFGIVGYQSLPGNESCSKENPTIRCSIDYEKKVNLKQLESWAPEFQIPVRTNLQSIFDSGIYLYPIQFKEYLEEKTSTT